MTLHSHLSPRVEVLFDDLADDLAARWPEDPLEMVPLVVGSGELRRWLMQELATRFGSAAAFAFVGPRAAFAGLADAILGGGDPLAALAGGAMAEEEGWSGPTLHYRVLELLRARLDEPAFTRVAGYLREGASAEAPASGAVVTPRELAFSGEVAGCLERLLHERPDESLEWAEAPDRAPAEHRWLAELLAALGAHAAPKDPATSAWGPSPAARLRAVQRHPAAARRPRLHLFGVSPLGPGDRAWLGALTRHLELHLFALSPTLAPWEPATTDALLAENARPAQELLTWLGEQGALAAAAPGPGPEPSERTLLARLQRVATTGDPATPGAWSDVTERSSVQLHACHGPLRQCEALRDELLRRFAADRSLEPRHVLVMTPDLATFAPLVAAVFARRAERAEATDPGDVAAQPQGDDAPAIPVAIADLGLRATNPVAAALLQALALTEERVTASGLLELLALGPVRRRFGLEDEELADLRALIVEAGMRWAWDADDRARHGQPPVDQNTLRFGLERLALGALMPDPGGLEVLEAAPGTGLPPAVPLELLSRERVERFGHLAELCAELQRLTRELTTARSLAEWREALRATLDALTATDNDAIEARQGVEDALDALLPASSFPGPRLGPAALSLLLGGAFDQPRGAVFTPFGAVTVAALEPRRAVPYRIIALLGMDDGAFPRRAALPSWDPMATPREDEHDRRKLDRALWLEAILCARDALLVLATGYEPKRGKDAPMSVVVTELEELVARALGAPGACRRHPLQPWSPRAFAHPEVAPYDRPWADGATTLRRLARAGPPEIALDADHGLAWPAAEPPVTELAAAELARALGEPQKTLLKRLGIEVEAGDATVPDRESFKLDHLEDWQIRDRLLRHAEALELTAGPGGPDWDGLLERAERRLRAEGALLPSAAGRSNLGDSMASVRKTWGRYCDELGTERGEPVEACVTVDGVTLRAVSPRVRRISERSVLAVLWASTQKNPRPKPLLTAWIELLVATAAGQDVAGASYVAATCSRHLLPPATSDDAVRILRDLVSAWRGVRTRPTLLFPTLSYAVARALVEDPAPTDREAVEGCSQAWRDPFQEYGDATDDWVATLFGEWPFEELVARAPEVARLARLVWVPLVQSTVKEPPTQRLPRQAARSEPTAGRGASSPARPRANAAKPARGKKQGGSR